ncbi:T9SS type A sorting domain-containing protein [candidate division KSB1 bacterium]|nr:T9SS type A sorting domain-containing protein [candidate division KSB1 bacterium]
MAFKDVKILISLKVLCLLMVCFIGAVYTSDSENNNDSKPLFMAHFMPWYQTPSITGYWGYHWTMNHFDPDKTNGNGKREIASVYYPLTGPYDSMDSDILEYQALLMKLSGIDGVMVDWYGMEDFWDYAILNESTHAIYDAVKKAGLQFSIVYEDQTIKHMVDNGFINQSGAIAHGKSVISYIEKNWSNTDTYLKFDNRPVLLTFGPQYFSGSSDWEALFSGLSVQPLFFTLDNRLSPVAAGAYPWPPMWKSNSSGILTQTALNDYLIQFYQKAAGWDYLVTSAFPGFNDIYKEAGVGDGYGFLDPKNGYTLKSTLQQAVAQNPDVIQLVTWNDYGEGTIIEPTEEFEYLYLEIVQQTRSAVDSAFVFQKQDLLLPMRIYNLRKQYPGNKNVNSLLDTVFGLIISAQIDSANILLDKAANLSGNGNTPITFFLEQNYPNPFNPGTTIKYKLFQGSEINLSVYNTRGQLVDTLVSGYKDKGEYTYVWDGGGHPSGLYFYRLTAGKDSAVKKCLRLK